MSPPKIGYVDAMPNSASGNLALISPLGNLNGDTHASP